MKLDDSVAPTQTASVSSKASDYLGLVQDFKSNPAYASAIQKTNTAVAKKYNFTLSQDEPVDVLVDKFSKLADANKFMQSLKNMSGV